MPLMHADTAVMDRWLWLRKRLPRNDGSQLLIDVGCGSGAFTIGAALRGYNALGLSWDARNQTVAAERARMCKASLSEFQIQDVRSLHVRTDLFGKFDVAICCEVIEHIIDDSKLMRDIARCLKPQGRLLLTTPNLNLKPIDPAHAGPFPTVENGGHVRKGYTDKELDRLCREAGLCADSVSYCTGLLSQTVIRLYFQTKKVHPLLAWCAIHPLRVFPPLLDDWLSRRINYPSYSICLEAHKPTLSRDAEVPPVSIPMECYE
jgi:2-polyprenyl-3-methyl-5-hydroxy-6-metoxy-1,4-benzoquinol methylase